MLKNFLYLAAFSTFAVIVFVAVTVYHELKVSQLKPQTQESIKPIPPTFDKKTLNELKKRQKVQVDLESKSVVLSGDGRLPNNQSATTPPPITNNSSESARTQLP